MSVTLNEVGLRFLLEDPDGPIGQNLRRRAENVTIQAQLGAEAIFERRAFNAADIISYSIENDDLGLVAYIGGDGGRISDYLDDKDEREGRPYTTALRIGFHA